MTHNDLSAQEIVDALHSHLAVLDRDGNITHVNEAWVRFSEERGALPSSTGVGVNYFAVCRARGATPEVEEMLAGIRDVINEAIPQFRAEYTCNTPKETYWYELMVKPLPKPHRGAVVYHTDITELKKAREEYAVILNGARGILWRAKLPGFQTIFTSKHVETILGYSVQAWTTQPDLWINRIHPEDREWVLAFTARATEEGRSHDFEYRMISADGQTVWLRNIVNVVVENGRPKEVVGISVDITERKRAQEALSGIAR
jgi:PAS domain S-box-containing protein